MTTTPAPQLASGDVDRIDSDAGFHALDRTA